MTLPSAGSPGPVVLAVAAVALTAACAARLPAPPPAAPPAPPPAGSLTTAAAPDPNAPEVNAAGDIPDNQVYVPFTEPGGRFTVSVPQGWPQATDGADTVFTDKFNSLRLHTGPRAAEPDAAAVRAQDVAPLQAATPGFALGDVQVVRRSAGPAVLMTYTATSAPNPVTGRSVPEEVQRYLFWRAGQEAVLTLSGPAGADNVDPWRTVTDSFRWQG